MHLNPDCMRDILLFVEDAPFRKNVSIDELDSSLFYSREEIMYACIKMIEAGFLSGSWSVDDFGMSVHYISDIKYPGHQLLADIRSDNVWNKTKGILSKVGSTSVSTIVQVSSGILAALIKAELGLI